MMIVASRGSNALDDRLFQSMFEARKRVFVDLLGWNVPVISDRFEVDQFDDEHAVYMIITDQNGGHLASARLLKTTRSHILSSLFQHLCAGPIPSGTDVLEITRFCLDRNLGATGRRGARDALVTALVRFALCRGIRTYTGVAEMVWLTQILDFGWDCRPLGVPRPVCGRMTGALAIAIDEQTPERLARRGIWVDAAQNADALAAAA